METVNGRYTLTKDGWKIIYKVEFGDEQYFEQVMLHPNCTNDAKENKFDLFNIKSCPNLHNGGEWEPMAITIKTNKLI